MKTPKKLWRNGEPPSPRPKPQPRPERSVKPKKPTEAPNVPPTLPPYRPNLLRAEIASRVLAGFLANPKMAYETQADILSRTIDFTDQLLKRLNR